MTGCTDWGSGGFAPSGATSTAGKTCEWNVRVVLPPSAMATSGVVRMWHVPLAEHVEPPGAASKADADHSANVRSMAAPAGESMSWQKPHISALSGAVSS